VPHISTVFYLLSRLSRKVGNLQHAISHHELISKLDYRVLIATIWDKGLAPCPRCLVPKSRLDKLGLVHDMAIRIKEFWQYMANKVEAARRVIYDLTKPITGVAVEGHLKEFSGVPTKVGVDFFKQRTGTDSHTQHVRMPLLSNLVPPSTPPICLLSI